MAIRWFCLLLIFGISQSLIAQLSVSDSAFSTAINTYYHSLGDQSPLYNGSEYLESGTVLQEGHVFFESQIFVKGTIWFDGMLFTDVPTLYDIVKDEVIIEHYSGGYKINLPAEKIEYFTLGTHKFVRLAPDSSGQIKAGFYEILYDRETKLFAKRIKRIREEHSNYQITNVIVQSNSRYIKKGGIYYPIKNLHSLLAVLKTKKKEIQQYFKKNNIKYNNDPENAMTIALGLYDRSTN